MAETIIKFYLSCPAGDSLQSPVGVAEFYKRYSFVRLPGEGFLFCEEKEPKVTRGGPRDPRRVGAPRPETLRIPGAGLDDADKEPQAHFM